MHLDVEGVLAAGPLPAQHLDRLAGRLAHRAAGGAERARFLHQHLTLVPLLVVELRTRRRPLEAAAGAVVPGVATGRLKLRPADPGPRARRVGRPLAEQGRARLMVLAAHRLDVANLEEDAVVAQIFLRVKLAGDLARAGHDPVLDHPGAGGRLPPLEIHAVEQPGAPGAGVGRRAGRWRGDGRRRRRSRIDRGGRGGRIRRCHAGRRGLRRGGRAGRRRRSGRRNHRSAGRLRERWPSWSLRGRRRGRASGRRRPLGSVLATHSAGGHHGPTDENDAGIRGAATPGQRRCDHHSVSEADPVTVTRYLSTPPRNGGDGPF